MPITSTIQQQTMSFTSATPGNSAIGDTATAGTSSSVARADHVHGREAAAAAGASAVGDTAAAGSATTVARSDHRHSREAFGTPVTVNGQTTSLSAGSLTTVARADHVHTLSNAMVLIASSTVGGTSVANITFSSIPGTYSSLMIVAGYRGDSTNPTYGTCWAAMQFNGDTASNYKNDDGSGQSLVKAGMVILSNNLYPSSTAACTCFIAAYASTSVHKSVVTTYTGNNSTTTNSFSQGVVAGVWSSTSAITSIKLYPGIGGNFNAGTTVSLYGVL